ncbi:uncharacterized protein TNCV_3129011 [Trichonephila clavipes]|nr:uncharacterized protein TNCV_3129011 [Trichonephila clavipes]
MTWSVAKSPRVAEQCDVNIQSINQSTTSRLTGAGSLLPPVYSEASVVWTRKEEKEKWDDKKRVKNREGSLGYPGFMMPVFTKESKPLGKRKRSLGHLGIVTPELTYRRINNLNGYWAYGSPVVKVLDHGQHVMSSSPVPQNTRRVGEQCTLNLSRAPTSSRWWGVVVRRGVLAQMSSLSLDRGSKLRGPFPKALV